MTRTNLVFSIAAAVVLLGGCDSLVAQKPSIVVQACAVDAVGNAPGDPPTASIGAKLEVRGWAADTLGKRVAKDLVVHLVSANGAVAASGERSATVPRPDVAGHFKMPEIASAGFHAEVSTAGMAPGIYDIMVESRFDKVNVACRPNRSLMLR